MYGGKFAFQNRLGWLVVGTKFTMFALFYFVLYLRANSMYKPPGGLYSGGGGGGDLTEGFLRYDFEGLIFGEVIHGGAYFRNFTVPEA